MSHYDIAVIGAGAAGLAAGLSLQASSRSFVVLEARDRIGGRTFTDTKSLGLPFDCGAHWLHAAAQNPFTKIADRLGYRYKADISWADSIMLMARTRAPAHLEAEADAYIGEVMERIFAAGEAGEDVAFSRFLEEGNVWNPLLRQIIGQITSHDPEDCSTADSARYVDEGGDFPVEAGFGALVARHAQDLPVTLSTPVNHIDWSGPQVRLETPRGTLTAGAIILAVPCQRADRRRDPLHARPSGSARRGLS
jgi:monoamine oxidase